MSRARLPFTDEEISKAVYATRGNRHAAARILGCSEKYIHNKAAQLGLPNSHDFRRKDGKATQAKYGNGIRAALKPGQRLVDTLEYTPPDTPLLARADREAENRELELRNAWYNVRVECLELVEEAELPGGFFDYTIRVRINQRLNHNRLERDLSTGIKATHKADGEPDFNVPCPRSLHR